MGRQEVHETLIVLGRNLEELQKTSIAPAGCTQSTSHELPDVMPRDVSAEKQRVDVYPEGVIAAHKRPVEIIRDLTPALPAGQHRRRRRSHGRWHLRERHRNTWMSHGNQLLDHVLQLSDVPGPSVVIERLPHLVTEDHVPAKSI